MGKALQKLHSSSSDWQNRLNSVTVNGVSVNYQYDGEGRQRSKSVGGQVTQYVYDGSNLIAETDANGTVTRMHIFGSGVDEPLVSIAGGVKQYYHADERGSIIAETSSTGALIRRYSYGPYGEVDNPTPGSIFRFTGQRYDSETNLYYYKARTYSAALGRFLEPDPIGTKGGINIYAYAENDPINKKDPSGLDDYAELDYTFFNDVTLGAGIAGSDGSFYPATPNGDGTVSFDLPSNVANLFFTGGIEGSLIRRL